MQKANNTSGINVLMVDNDAKFLASAKECLNLQGGLNVTTAQSSKPALEMMKKKTPDVIVCALHMQDTTGFEFLKTLRNDGNEIPFIVFTIDDDKEVALEAFRQGANGFIGKYGAPSVVYSQLKEHIDKVTKNSLTEKSKQKEGMV